MIQDKPREARKEHQWCQWIAAWQASGLSVRVFCGRAAGRDAADGTGVS